MVKQSISGMKNFSIFAKMPENCQNKKSLTDVREVEPFPFLLVVIALAIYIRVVRSNRKTQLLRTTLLLLAQHS